MNIAIIDYGMGNLRSVQKAFERVGAEATIVSRPEEIEKANRIVLPGVGAFKDAMAELRRKEFPEPIRQAIQAGKPFLGICLGLQMLFDVSYENGEFQGLGIVPGKVVKFELPVGYAIPQMGWNQVHFVNNAQSDCPLLKGISEKSYFYFVHSYYVCPQNYADVALTCDYGLDFCAMIHRDNLFACQFHPEKSQENGLKILENFVNLQD